MRCQDCAILQLNKNFAIALNEVKTEMVFNSRFIETIHMLIIATNIWKLGYDIIDKGNRFSFFHLVFRIFGVISYYLSCWGYTN